MMTNEAIYITQVRNLVVERMESMQKGTQCYNELQEMMVSSETRYEEILGFAKYYDYFSSTAHHQKKILN